MTINRLIKRKTTKPTVNVPPTEYYTDSPKKCQGKNTMKEFKYQVGVRFKGNNLTYHYATNDYSLRAGDKVIVDAPSTGYTIVTVAATPTHRTPIAAKPIVSKIYDAEYIQYQQSLTNQKDVEKLTKLLNEAETLRKKLYANGMVF